MTYYLGVDNGGTSTKAALYDRLGRELTGGVTHGDERPHVALPYRLRHHGDGHGFSVGYIRIGFAHLLHVFGASDRRHLKRPFEGLLEGLILKTPLLRFLTALGRGGEMFLFGHLREAEVLSAFQLARVS